MESNRKNETLRQDTVLPSAKEIDLFRMKMYRWADKHLVNYPWRKKSASNYRRVLTEILLQRTRAEAVAKIYYDFFKRFPSWMSLHSAGIDEIGEVLKPIGLYRRRSEVFSRLSGEMVNNNGRFPRTRGEIEKLPGVGQYVANSIELFVLGRPMPLLDVNMARLLERYFGPRKLADIRYDPYLQDLSIELLKKTRNPVEFNWAVLDYARMVCKENPCCDACMYSKRCYFMNQKNMAK